MIYKYLINTSELFSSNHPEEGAKPAKDVIVYCTSKQLERTDSVLCFFKEHLEEDMDDYSEGKYGSFSHSYDCWYIYKNGLVVMYSLNNNSIKEVI